MVLDEASSTLYLRPHSRAAHGTGPPSRDGNSADTQSRALHKPSVRSGGPNKMQGGIPHMHDQSWQHSVSISTSNCRDNIMPDSSYHQSLHISSHRNTLSNVTAHSILRYNGSAVSPEPMCILPARSRRQQQVLIFS
jgi:hypothetical protein